mmetsp:Transcript_25600/g.60736  ORF Transcript_25600/g.60736 Transcript_25600/m.60736 type:complete len:215 (-) Transcript_25600:6-650(-)
MVAGSKPTLLFLFEATAPRHGEDLAWDVVAEIFGLLGRGGGWDRLPRGIHKGVTSTRVLGNLVLFVSSASPYAQHPKLAGLAPFPRAPQSRADLVTGECSAPAEEVERMMRGWEAFGEEGASCQELCQANGKACSAASLWALAVDYTCSSLSQVLQRHSKGVSCSECEHAHAGLFSPTVDELGSCRLPSLVAMTCARPNPRQPSTLVVCPCESK